MGNLDDSDEPRYADVAARHGVPLLFQLDSIKAGRIIAAAPYPALSAAEIPHRHGLWPASP
jgi:hypothetical protein